jgi:REP element-mobilizing transposase RayT
MARQLRIQFPGALYHITHRGNERKSIFSDDKDKETFLDLLSFVVERFDWRCHSYVLMPNHYHIIIETPKGNLSRGMMQLNSIYTQRFNRRHKRVGHLFQGRYKSILVEKETYLLELSRYIVLNPVRARLVAHPGEWQWSSYNATICKIAKPDFLNAAWILSQFGSNRKKAIESYMGYVIGGYGNEFPKGELVGGAILGSEKFLNEINFHLNKEGIENIKEIPRAQRYSPRIRLDEIFQKERRAGKSRDEIIFTVYKEFDFTMREIADYLEVHYATVSRAIKAAVKE